jgi:hypothetical protein
MDRADLPHDRVHHITKNYCRLLLKTGDKWLAHQERSQNHPEVFPGGPVLLDDRFHNCTASGVH